MSSNLLMLERISDTEIVMRREFHAAAEDVFDAYTEPEYVRRWWAPESRGVVMVECEAEVRVGGTYRYVLGRGEAERFGFHGRYLEVVRPTRLVCTQTFEGFPDAEAIVTISFDERDDVTHFVAHERYPSKEALDAAIASGMEEGVRETFDLLAELVATMNE